jgi:hypothetical protein
MRSSRKRFTINKGDAMKRIVIAALLATAIGTTYADDPAANADNGYKPPPTLDELWNETETGHGIKTALVDGTPSAELLLGYEHSDLDDNGTKAANALISRIRLNYQTGAYKGFDGFVQAQYVGPIGDHYSPEDPDYDVITDPEEFRFHQAYLGYTGYDSRAQFGAQEIILDNARFIGNVGWRLNAQSFNAISVANHSISNVALYYAYADSINRIDGEMDHDRQYHLVNAAWNVSSNNTLAGFAYLQRNDNPGIDKLDTYGLRLWGNCDLGYHEFIAAVQRDAYYGSAFIEADLDAIKLGGGVEYISGGNENNERFRTLDGTAHKFNGWADQFAAGPASTATGALEGGLVDGYVQITGKAGEKVTLQGVYHYFNTADETDGGFKGEYGQEIDVMAKVPVCDRFSLLAKAAFYIKGENDADNLTEDETVFWLRGTYTF